MSLCLRVHAGSISCFLDKGTRVMMVRMVQYVDSVYKSTWTRMSRATHPSFMSFAFVNSPSNRSETESISSTYVFTMSFRIPDLPVPIAMENESGAACKKRVHDYVHCVCLCVSVCTSMKRDRDCTRRHNGTMRDERLSRQ